MGIYLIKCIQPSGFSAKLEASVLELSAASAAAVIIPTLCDASSEPMASGFLFLRDLQSTCGARLAVSKVFFHTGTPCLSAPHGLAPCWAKAGRSLIPRAFVAADRFLSAWEVL